MKQEEQKKRSFIPAYLGLTHHPSVEWVSRFSPGHVKHGLWSQTEMSSQAFQYPGYEVCCRRGSGIRTPVRSHNLPVTWHITIFPNFCLSAMKWSYYCPVRDITHSDFQLCVWVFFITEVFNLVLFLTPLATWPIPPSEILSAALWIPRGCQCQWFNQDQ